VWNGEQQLATDQFTVTLEPHASRLLAISGINRTQVYDANLRLNRVVEEIDRLVLEADYAVSDAELTLDHTPALIQQNGHSIPFTTNGTTVKFDLPESGKFEIVW
jgi:hypothetical protein